MSAPRNFFLIFFFFFFFFLFDYIRLIIGTSQMESNGEVVAMEDREFRFGNTCFNGARVSLF